jgi:hypothetical protein
VQAQACDRVEMRGVDRVARRNGLWALLVVAITAGAVGCREGREPVARHDAASRDDVAEPSAPPADSRASATPERSPEPAPSPSGGRRPTGQPGDPLPAPEHPPPIRKRRHGRSWINGEKPPGTPPPPAVTARREGRTVVVEYRVRWDLEATRRAALLSVAVDGLGDNTTPIGGDFPVTGPTGRVTVKITDVMRGPYTVHAGVRSRRGFPSDSASVSLG